MKLSLVLAAFSVALSFTTADAADTGTKQLSPARLDAIDQLGYFTPAFKQAVHDYVFAHQTLTETTADQDRMTRELPALQKEAAKEQASAVALREELARYEHPEETNFDTLQARANDASVKPETLLALAQAYVWTFPASPHAAEAQRILQQVQTKITAQEQAVLDAEAARVAAHAALVKRAQGHDLTLAEWRGLLRDLSQDDLIKLIGRPSLIASDDWTYSGPWAVDPVHNRHVGLEITFDAGRVINVDEKPSPP